jgi:hypothetical protein
MTRKVFILRNALSSFQETIGSFVQGVVRVTASVEVEVTYNNWLMMYVARIRGSACGGGACYANKQRWKPKLVLTFQKEPLLGSALRSRLLSQMLMTMSM